MLGLILFLGVVSAHDVDYNVLYGHDSGEPDKFSKTYYSDNVGIVSKTVWTYYDNDERHSTYDYRHGYSYRATRDYYESKIEGDAIRSIREKAPSRVNVYSPFSSGRDYHAGRHAEEREREFIDLDIDNHGYRSSGLIGYSYEYVLHLRSYEKRDCYVTPPADRLFYIAC